MKQKGTAVRALVIMSVFLLSVLLLFKYFNLTWVEMEGDEVKITINFLVPMNQAEIGSRLRVVSERDDCKKFNYRLKWLAPQIVEIRLTEENAIKGLKAKLYVEDVPAQWKGLKKSETVSVQFSTPITLKEAGKNHLISSMDSFMISFNTPVYLKELKKYTACEAAFDIAAMDHGKVVKNGKSAADKFLFTPKVPLENGKKYILLIHAGMRAASGRLLEQDCKIQLQVDQKPVITNTYPADQDKWIGLYPKITFTCQAPVAAARARIGDIQLKGIMTDEHHGFFLLSDMLQPDTSYQLLMQVKTLSGEKSKVTKINFSTTSLNDKRGWIVIHCGKEKKITYYEGTKAIKTMVCGTGRKLQKSDYGNYYVLGKNEVYEKEQSDEGANYWIKLSDEIGLHGYRRYSNWQLKEEALQEIGGRTLEKHIILSDEDARWLYEKTSDQMMVIIRN